MAPNLILPLTMLMLSITGHASCTWCVCKEMPEATLQKTLDYACGAGADCGPIHTNGPCFQPNSVRSHCSYAVNSFFQKKGQSQGSCDFAGTAAVSTSDPSHTGCSYPVTASGGGTSTSGTPGISTGGNQTPVTTYSNSSTNTPSTTTTTPTSTTSPYSTTPSSNGVLGGGIGTGVTPGGGAGINTDITDDAAFGVSLITSTFYSSLASFFIAMVFWA
ncbi:PLASMODESMATA CALLOSE-BINDING PROTEIN 3-like [Euphorbia lathyris]|uniref:PLASMODESMATA CALLOSE-BINDING PROTEIN 3-like n=1 Tax=Euphorbia lathyris TaxID=212925 RepID=UPI003313CAF4